MDERRCLGPGLTALFIPQFIFNASACKHDEYYKKGGGLVEKVMADSFFFSFMLEDISEGGYRFCRRYFYFSMATLYFLAVSLFGVFFFNWHR